MAETERNRSSIDMRNTVLSDGEVYELNSNWDFYWNQHLEPTDVGFFIPDGIVESQYWIESKSGNVSIEALGYATYHATLLLNPDDIGKDLALLIRENNTASRYYINGELVGEVGHAASNPVSSQATWEPAIITFNSSSDSVDILIHASNYEFREGGLGRPLKIGSQKSVQKFLDRKHHRDMLFIGIYLAMALYHLIISLLRRNDVPAILLAILYFSWILRTLFSANFVCFQVFSNIPWDVQIRMEYLSLYVVIFTTSFYVMHMFKRYLFTYARRLLTGVTAFFLLTLILPDTVTISRIAAYYLYFLVPVSLIPFSAVIRAVMDRNRKGQIIFLGGLVLVIAVGHDTLYTLDIISTGFIAPYTFIVFIVGQAFIVAKDYADAFSALATSEVELKHEIDLRANAEEELLAYQNTLEKTVALRTTELDNTNQKLLEEITQKEENEAELQRLNDAKDKFFSIIAHDLRGPIGSQMTYIELINQEFSGFTLEDFKETFKNLGSTNKKIYALLENLLSWSRLQLGVIEPEFQEVRLSKIYENVLPVAQQQAIAKNITIHLSNNEDSLIKVDPSMIEVVIRNLLNNAIKFSNPGGDIHIIIDSTSNSTQFSIKDEGIGIPAEVQAGLFDLASKFRQDGTAGEASSGLGLLLVKEFTHTNGGKVWFESIEDQGSTFFLEFPMVSLNPEG